MALLPNTVLNIAVELAASTSQLHRVADAAGTNAIASDLGVAAQRWQSEHPELAAPLRSLSSLLPPPVSRVQLAKALSAAGEDLSAFSQGEAGDLLGAMHERLQTILRESGVPTPLAVALQMNSPITGVATVRAKSERGRENILVIDDEMAIIRVMKRQLESKGYRVLAALNGAEAFKLVNDWYADETQPTIGLALVDINLPDGPGENLVNRLRSVDPDLFSVFHSGGEAPMGLLHRIKRSSFLPKPSPTSEVLEHLRRTLDEIRSP